jgi:DnaJ-class molecular chaperone
MTLSMINCDSCKGRKKIVGLGNIQQDCPSCRGIGWIEIPDDTLKVTLADVMENPKRRKKKITHEAILQC